MLYNIGLGLVLFQSGLAYFTDVGHYLVWVYLSYDRETNTTAQPFSRVI